MYVCMLNTYISQTSRSRSDQEEQGDPRDNARDRQDSNQDVPWRDHHSRKREREEVAQRDEAAEGSGLGSTGAKRSTGERPLLEEEGA